jgi:hypothetical protein
MIPKRLEEVNEVDLDNLLANSVPEGKTTEYKKVLPGNSDGDKKELLADVSSFANTTGGDLIFGIDEAQGVPTGIPGLDLNDPDSEVLRLDSIINDGLEPRIRFATRVIHRDGKLPALIVRTERSWIGPHRVVFKRHDRFYARNSAGKYLMDVSELRSAFTLADSVIERVRRFRSERIRKLGEDDTPIGLVRGTSRTILHCIPLESFSRAVQYDVLQYSRGGQARLPPLLVRSSWDVRINLDGIVSFSRGDNNSTSYTQLFRSGAVEAVETYWLNVGRSGERRTIPHLRVEKGLLDYLGILLRIQKELGVNPPIFVALTLTGTSELGMASDFFDPYDQEIQIREDNLILPEIVVEGFDEAPTKILRPLFDLVWNACGYAKSKNFDDKGNWLGG